MKIGFWGAGEMAEGILSAIPSKKSVIMAETREERAAELKKKYGVSTTPSVAEVAKKADLILNYRQQHGQFERVEDLKNITGFGDKTIAKIKDQLSV